MIMKEITKENVEILDALCGVIMQYMPKLKDGSYDHQFMGAGEDALDVLADYGLATEDGRCIVPTKLFEDIQDEFSDFRKEVQ